MLWWNVLPDPEAIGYKLFYVYFDVHLLFLISLLHVMLYALLEYPVPTIFFSCNEVIYHAVFKCYYYCLIGIL